MHLLFIYQNQQHADLEIFVSPWIPPAQAAFSQHLVKLDQLVLLGLRIKPSPVTMYGELSVLVMELLSTGKRGTTEHGNLFSCAPTDRMTFSTVSTRNMQLGCPWIFTFFVLVFFLCSNNFAKSAHKSISELSSLCMFCGSVCTGRKQNSYRPWAKGKYSHFNKSEFSEGHLNVSWKILSISASAHLIDTQLLLPSLRDVTLSSSWTPASGILAVLLSSRSKIKYYSAL